MPSSTSPNMVLFLPVPSVTAGPQWATETTSNWSTLDTHDHTAGKGVQIPIAALNVNADFSWLTFGQTNIGYLSLVDKLATGNLTVNSSFGNVAGLPYWRNSSGVVTALALAGAAITIPSGTSALGSLLFTAIAAPGNPSAGFGSLWYDSTATNVMVKNSAGVVKHGVQTKAAVSHQFLTSIADDGSSVLAQPASTDVSGILQGYQQQSRITAISLLGSSDLYEFFDDFDRVTNGAGHPNGWTVDQAGGTVVMNNSSTAEIGGTFLAAITAVASNRANLYDATQNVNPGTKDLYVAFRMAVLSGADGNSINAMGLTTSTFGRQLVAGVIGFLSSTTFQVAYNGQVIAAAGTALSLGTAIDSAYHLFEFWIIGTTLKARIDGGTIQTAGSAISGYSPKSGYASLCSTGATAAVRSHEGSWMYVASLK